MDLMNMLVTSQYLHNNGGGGGGSSGGENKLAEIFNKTVTTITEKDLEGVTAFPGDIFKDCKTLTSLSMPDSVVTIGSRICGDCPALMNVKLSNSLKEISNYAFQNCGALESITLPDSLTKIGMSAFSSNSKLANINFPSALTTIDQGAFSSCAFTSIVIPDTVKGTLYMTFIKNNKLKTAIIGNGVKTLNMTFQDSWMALESVVVGTGVDTLKSAFTFCSSLKSVTIKAETPPSVDTFSFNQVPEDCAIYVPANSVDAYKAATNWSARADYIFAIEE